MDGNDGSFTLEGDSLQNLADDPDDLLREIQQLGALSGGNPTQTVISVNGFQGSSPIPPKTTIASVLINPDRYSAEYREPPLGGGRVEIYTKPGASTFHGSLFSTISSPWMNARDPLSTSRAPLGKQRYGGEITGPLIFKKLDVSATLEHRQINNYGVVDAVVLNQALLPTVLIQNVPTPQTLWIGLARLDWQLAQKSVGFISYDADVNQLSNVGVGGIVLENSGYAEDRSDHTVRVSNQTTYSAHLLHEDRVSLELRSDKYFPTSLQPQVQVAGSFTSGGGDLGSQQINELITEVDDDVILSKGKHLFKAGLQFQSFRENRFLPTDFNGTYIFGGGSAPLLDGAGNPTNNTVEITGLQQYKRSLMNQPGGTATEYSGVSGSGQVGFVQVRSALFAQELWKARGDVSVSLGFRYFLQSSPNVFNGAVPRIGIAWNPANHKSWMLHAHAGLFSGVYGTTDYAELKRENGIKNVTRQLYNAPFGNPFSGNTTSIQSERTLAPGFHAVSYASTEAGVDRAFRAGLKIAAAFTELRIWNDDRSVNVNAPLNGQLNGPRAYGPNLNILQWQNSGYGVGDMEVIGASDRFGSRLRVNVSAIRNNLRQDSDNSLFYTPQSTFSNAGEFARNSGQGLWQVFANIGVGLPFSTQISISYYGVGGQPFNLITGNDNNGDGDFNDRPQLAAPGENGAIDTRYGWLIDSGGFGPSRRNMGQLPWSHYLDANVQHTFKIGRAAKPSREQELTVNVRSSNVLNHLNVTDEGGVLGSPLFGIPDVADPGRRVEGGLRYSF